MLCEVGLPGKVAETFALRKVDREPLRLVWSAGHLSGKALPILMRSLATLPSEIKWSLDILGQGRETRSWQKSARHLGVDYGCKWHGWVTRDEVIQVMSGCHLMIISSLKDLTSTVIIEALSQGLPVVCLDHCGFSDVITSACGIKIPVTDMNGVVQGMADAIALIANDEELRRRMAAAALVRAADYGWDNKARQLTAIYLDVTREWRGV